MDLADEFHSLASSFCQNPDHSTLCQWWDRIATSYAEPQRHYHTIAHILSLWTNLASLVQPDGQVQGDGLPKLSSKDVGVVRFAILFHDVVYDPKSSHGSNETESIQVFRDFARDCGLVEDVTSETCALIEATIKHAVPENCSTPSLPLFLDLDLEVLGRPPHMYARYAREIRQEYIHYPDDAFNTGRYKVLSELGQGSIYFTQYWRDKVGGQAKENLNWEMNELLKQT